MLRDFVLQVLICVGERGICVCVSESVCVCVCPSGCTRECFCKYAGMQRVGGYPCVVVGGYPELQTKEKEGESEREREREREPATWP